MITLRKIIETCGNIEIYKEGRWMPVTEEVQQKFDIDLEFGRLGEDFVKAFQKKNNKIEVKTERGKWKDTGNIAIEIRYKGNKSGISVTEAETWIHLLSYNNVIEGGFIFKTQLLRDKIKKLHKEGNLKLTMGGDDKMSQLALLPIKDLLI